MNVTIKKLSLIAIFAITLLIYACQKTDSLTTADEKISITETESQAVEDAVNNFPNYLTSLLAEPVVVKMDENTEMSILYDGAPENIENQGIEVISIDANGRRHSLFRCIDTLTLSDGQLDSIKSALRKLHQCRKAHITTIRKMHHQIILRANKQRAFLIKQYREGEITIQRLRTELKQLNREAFLLIRNNPAKKAHLKAIRQCNRRFYGAIRNTLTLEQWGTIVECRR